MIHDNKLHELKLIWEKLSENTLFHGTKSDIQHDIKKYGLFPITGNFVRHFYSDYDTSNDDNGLVFAADKKNINKAFSAMLYHVGEKVGKHLNDVSFEDIKRHGMLVIIKDKKDYFIYAPDNEDFEKIVSVENLPPWVEPGDYVNKNIVKANIILTGNKLVSFFRKKGKEILPHMHAKDIEEYKKWYVIKNTDSLSPENIHSLSSYQINDLYLKLLLNKITETPTIDNMPIRNSDNMRIGPVEKSYDKVIDFKNFKVGMLKYNKLINLDVIIDNMVIGHLDYDVYEIDNKQFGIIRHVSIIKEHRGKGIAISLYKFLLDNLDGIISDRSLTKVQGKGSFHIWKKLEKSYFIYIMDWSKLEDYNVFKYKQITNIDNYVKKGKSNIRLVATSQRLK